MEVAQKKFPAGELLIRAVVICGVAIHIASAVSALIFRLDDALVLHSQKASDYDFSSVIQLSSLKNSR